MCMQASCTQDLQQKHSDGGRVGQHAANTGDQSLHKIGSDALMSSSSASASSSAQPQASQQDAGRGGHCDSSGQGMADFAGELQHNVNMAHGQQQLPRRSSDSFASLPCIQSNERLAPGGHRQKKWNHVGFVHKSTCGCLNT